MVQSTLPRQTLTPALDASYRFCGAWRGTRRGTFTTASCSSRLISGGRCAPLYAFMRRTDDLADDPVPGRDGDVVLLQWRGDVHRALDGGETAPGRGSPRWPRPSSGTRSPGTTLTP